MSRGGRVLLLAACWVFVVLALSATAAAIARYYLHRRARLDAGEVAVVWGAVYTTDMTGIGLLLVELTGIVVLCVAAAFVFDYLCDKAARQQEGTDAILV
jgi:hypothetical protein